MPQIDVPTLKGFSQKTKKIQADTPTGQLLDLLCKSFKLKADDFALTSTDGFKFSKKEGLGYYGLGTKFPKMTVKLVEAKTLAKE